MFCHGGVAELFLQLDGREVLLGQRLFVLGLIELAGDLIEEGGDLADALDDQRLVRADADPARPFQEAEALGLAFQIADVDVGCDQVLKRQGASFLFGGIGADPLEVSPELRSVHRAFAGGNDMLGAQAPEHVGLRSADDGEADDQQSEQGDGPFGLGEVAEHGNHRRGLTVGRRRAPPRRIGEGAVTPQALDAPETWQQARRRLDRGA